MRKLSYLKKAASSFSESAGAHIIGWLIAYWFYSHLTSMPPRGALMAAGAVSRHPNWLI